MTALLLERGLKRHEMFVWVDRASLIDFMKDDKTFLVPTRVCTYKERELTWDCALNSETT